MFVLLNGTIEVYAQDEHEQPKLVTTQHAGEFTGELDLISSRHTLANGFTATDCVLLRVSRPELRRLMRSEGDIANLIMQAAIWRRVGLLEGSVAGIVLLGSSTAADTIQLQRFLTRNSYPHRLLEPSDEPSVDAESEDPATPGATLPAVIFPDGRILRRPTIAKLADELGLMERLDPDITYDIAIVGAGPSGLATAVYGASEGLSILVIESVAPGGQAGTSSKIENYLGFPTGVSGLELATRAQVQAQKFGARLAIPRDVVAIEQTDGFHRLVLSDGNTVRSRAVVIATGAKYSKLTAENYDRFEHQGIHYAATGMEATLCRNQEVVVVVGGNSAGQAAIFLSGFASHVHLIIRGESLAKTMSHYLIARIENSARITLRTRTELQRLEGETVLERVIWANRDTKVVETREITAVFVMIGAVPNSAWLSGTVTLDKKGFDLTGTAEAFENSRYATSVSGVYAVGDVRSESVKRVASAVGEGSVVIADVHRYLATHREVFADADSTLAALKAANTPPAK